jgi:hypothetical protein
MDTAGALSLLLDLAAKRLALLLHSILAHPASITAVRGNLKTGLGVELQRMRRTGGTGAPQMVRW